MNVEELRNYCLSLGDDVEERMPFGAFKAAQGVLVFYVCNHMFCYFDIDHFEVVTVKCQPERIGEMMEQYDCITKPHNMNPKYWIGILPEMADNTLLEVLISNSYQLIKHKYRRHS